MKKKKLLSTSLNRNGLVSHRNAIKVRHEKEDDGKSNLQDQEIVDPKLPELKYLKLGSNDTIKEQDGTNTPAYPHTQKTVINGRCTRVFKDGKASSDVPQASSEEQRAYNDLQES